MRCFIIFVFCMDIYCIYCNGIFPVIKMQGARLMGSKRVPRILFLLSGKSGYSRLKGLLVKTMLDIK